jgi:ribosome biogenesis GTPase A
LCAGVTKSMQEVQLDKKVTLLDCPGLVMAGGNRTDASVALRNALKVIFLYYILFYVNIFEMMVFVHQILV